MWDKACLWFGRTTVGALLYAMMAGAWRMAGKEAGMGYFVVGSAILLASLVVSCIVYFVIKSPDAPSNDPNTMSLAIRRIVIAYLLILGALLVALLVDLNTVDFPETAVSIGIVPAPNPTPLPTATPTPVPSPTSKPVGNTTDSSAGTSIAASTSRNIESGAPTVLQVIPRATTGNAPTIYLAVFGANFTEKSLVRLNGSERPTARFGPTLSPTLLEAQPETSDLLGKGTISVDVITDGRISNALIVPVEKPFSSLDLGPWKPRITREIQLMLMVLLAGALGSLVHALRSISDFIGNRTAVASWFWWYITRPLLGMALALIFYAVLRGGFLAGSPADAKVVNPFGVIAIGALVGMFADKAAEKLAEIFSTLFQPKSGDARTDKLSFPVVSKLEPAELKVNTGFPGVLTIRGDHLEKIIKVKFDDKERKVKSSSAQEVIVDLQQEDVATVRDIAVTVMDDNKAYTAPKLSIKQ